MFKSPKQNKTILTLQDMFWQLKKELQKTESQRATSVSIKFTKARIMTPPLPGGRGQADRGQEARKTHATFRESSVEPRVCCEAPAHTLSQFTLLVRHCKEIIWGVRHYLLWKAFTAMLFPTANTHKTCKRPVSTVRDINASGSVATKTFVRVFDIRIVLISFLKKRELKI